MLRTIAVAVLISVAVPVWGAGESKTWEGTWTNRKYGTSGPLKCVATQEKEGVWNGTFTGKFKGDPFEYKATFQSKKKGRKQILSGKATIRGHKYQWVGEMNGKNLRGQYKSTVGYFGGFVLKGK